MRTWVSWSSGKDSAWSLHALRQGALREGGDAEVTGLFTTVNAAFDRVAMHAVRRTLLEAQARPQAYRCTSSRSPTPAPTPSTSASWARSWPRRETRASRPWRSATCSSPTSAPIASGSSPAPASRRCSRCGAATPTPCARAMIDGGLVAHVTCVDPRGSTGRWPGARFDHALLADLPAGVDPCGENGELHTFVSDGPMFQAPIVVRPARRH